MLPTSGGAQVASEVEAPSSRVAPSPAPTEPPRPNEDPAPRSAGTPPDPAKRADPGPVGGEKEAPEAAPVPSAAMPSAAVSEVGPNAEILALIVLAGATIVLMLVAVRRGRAG